MSFLKLILILLGAYLIFRLSLRYLLPLFLQYVSRKLQNKFREAMFSETNSNENHRQVKNDHSPGVNRNKKTEAKNSEPGEYIDFEEIE